MAGLEELNVFLKTWEKDQYKVKPIFDTIYQFLATQEDVQLDYKGRAGISHSLRAKHNSQQERGLFVLVDIIDDDPDARWLSICFYADMISDPEKMGDVVPQGLMGEDACCFDIDSPDDVQNYILDRVKEACHSAGLNT